MNKFLFAPYQLKYLLKVYCNQNECNEYANPENMKLYTERKSEVSLDLNHPIIAVHIETN